MTLQERINAFQKLGDFMHELVANAIHSGESKNSTNEFIEQGKGVIHLAKVHNAWFTPESVCSALRSLAEMLDAEKLKEWANKYGISDKERGQKIALIMAGNIPLVGFHDFLCVLICGDSVLVKLSSDDKVLLPFLSKVLCHIQPAFTDLIEFTEGKIQKCSAVIATGSGNTARYFEYYFGKMPHIIRKNRTSVAVLDGSETKEELELLSEDVFAYFGLGCRNVSKLFVPENYDLNRFFEGIFHHREVIQHNKYANNFDYNRAVYLMGDDTSSLLENGFLFLVKSTAYASPVAVLFYEYYTDAKSLNARLKTDEEQIQCIVSKNKEIENRIPFGKAQHPGLSDYADSVDTMQFLSSL